MSIIMVKELVDAGVHFGHRVSRWNPKMAPYIYCKRNLIHIINLRETVKGLIRAYRFLVKVVARGDDVLFVGTKRQAKGVVEAEARRCGMHWATERWLGGTLTNFRTIRSRMKRLLELEKMEADGTLSRFSKKMISTLTRERRKIKRNLDGIRAMERFPGALVVVDPRHEYIAVREANKLGIPVIGIIDTDSDPDLVDLPIPANDDAMRSIEILVHKLANAVIEGKAARTTLVGKEAAEGVPARVAPAAERPSPLRPAPDEQTAVITATPEALRPKPEPAPSPSAAEPSRPS